MTCDKLFILVRSRTILICFFFKQKTAYEMSISDWSSDVCSSDLPQLGARRLRNHHHQAELVELVARQDAAAPADRGDLAVGHLAMGAGHRLLKRLALDADLPAGLGLRRGADDAGRETDADAGGRLAVAAMADAQRGAEIAAGQIGRA